jgi:GNAT superfamily N-acetyltransferase
MPEPYTVRDAIAAELDALARLWFDAWQDAHAGIVPAEVVRARTLPSFCTRLQTMLPELRVIGPVGSPVGFHRIKDDELEQLFVAAASRGRGVAAALIRDAEHCLRKRGLTRAWLACAIGNERAGRFYQKCGWYCVGTMVNRLDLGSGVYELEVRRFEKVLSVPIRKGSPTCVLRCLALP